MSRPLDDLSYAVETAALLLPYLPKTEQNMRASLAEPGGTSYDGVGRRGSVIWCDDHEREIRECRKAELDCDGVPLESRPDPTGDAAVNPEQLAIRADAKIVASICRRWSHDARELTRIVSRYKDDPLPSDQDATAESNEPACELHGKAGIIRPKAHRMERADDWYLPSPTDVCSACRDYIRNRKRIPSTDEIEWFERRGKWPHLTDRLGKAG